MNNPDALLKIIDRGQVFASDVDDDPVDMINTMKKTLFAAGIRAVWMSGEDISYPVILRDTDIPQDGSGCESYNPANWEDDGDSQEGFFKVDGEEATGTATRFCDGDHAFFLMGANPDVMETICSSGPVEGDVLSECEIKSITLSKLRGWDDLNGSNFGGLKPDDIACSSNP